MAPSLKLPVILLALAAAALAGALTAQNTEQKIVGPLAIAVHGAQVVVAAPGVLYRLDTAGTLQGRDDGAIAADAHDAGLAWLGEDLLLSPGADGKFMRCSGASCAPFSDNAYAPTGPVQVAAATPGRLWLLETDVDRAHRFHEDGRRIDTPLTDLRSPGDLWQNGNDLYVANTGAGQFERYELHKRGIADPAIVARFPDAAEARDPVDRPLRLLPGGDGSFRVLLSNRTRTRGALAQVSAAGAVERLGIPALVNPVSFAVAGADLLLVDEDRMQVLRLAADGRVTVFGDASFNAALGAQHGVQETLRLAYPLLAILATVLAVLGGSLLLRGLLWRESEPARPVTPGGDGIAWLPNDRSMLPRRALRALLHALPLALFPALLAARFGMETLGLCGGIAVLVLATVPALVRAARAQVPDQLRIGLRGKQLVIEHAQYGAREYWLTQIAWNEQELRPEPEVVLPLQRDGVALFHLPTLRAALFPLLAAGKQLRQ